VCLPFTRSRCTQPLWSKMYSVSLGRNVPDPSLHPVTHSFHHQLRSSISQNEPTISWADYIPFSFYAINIVFSCRTGPSTFWLAYTSPIFNIERLINDYILILPSWPFATPSHSFHHQLRSSICQNEPTISWAHCILFSFYAINIVSSCPIRPSTFWLPYTSPIFNIERLINNYILF